LGQLLGGLPYDVPLSTVNRQCSSGLQAVANVSASIKAGIIDIGLAGGVESMSMYGMMDGIDPTKFSTKIGDNADAVSCMMPMGITSENVAEKYGISRETQDLMAVDSHKKAVQAQKAGFFSDEIVPTTTKDKEGKEVVVTADEGPRAGTDLTGLSKLKAAFKMGGSTTAGNSSQVSDGAAMVLLARRSAAKKAGLPILARLRSYAVVGVDPKYMGIGPAFAIPAALEKANLKVEDIDIYEINEAFASQATMSVDHLKIPMEKVNPKGGAIALGHPLGCTGSRQIATLLPELKRQNKKLGVVSMCIGTGMGAAGVIESEQ
jgi:acetyl-CoA acyltransferase 1